MPKAGRTTLVVDGGVSAAGRTDDVGEGIGAAGVGNEAPCDGSGEATLDAAAAGREGTVELSPWCAAATGCATPQPATPRMAAIASAGGRWSFIEIPLNWANTDTS